jgi:hypothetical protein
VNAGIDYFIEGLLKVEGGGGAIADFGHERGYQKRSDTRYSFEL